MNEIKEKQYENLRKCFEENLVEPFLGEDYYNLAMDVYDCEKKCYSSSDKCGLSINRITNEDKINDNPPSALPPMHNNALFPYKEYEPVQGKLIIKDSPLHEKEEEK